MSAGLGFLSEQRIYSASGGVGGVPTKRYLDVPAARPGQLMPQRRRRLIVEPILLPSLTHCNVAVSIDKDCDEYGYMSRKAARRTLQERGSHVLSAVRRVCPFDHTRAGRVGWPCACGLVLSTASTYHACVGGCVRGVQAAEVAVAEVQQAVQPMRRREQRSLRPAVPGAGAGASAIILESLSSLRASASAPTLRKGGQRTLRVCCRGFVCCDAPSHSLLGVACVHSSGRIGRINGVAVVR
jgi:hypothetical protein